MQFYLFTICQIASAEVTQITCHTACQQKTFARYFQYAVWEMIAW